MSDCSVCGSLLKCLIFFIVKCCLWLFGYLLLMLCKYWSLFCPCRMINIHVLTFRCMSCCVLSVGTQESCASAEVFVFNQSYLLFVSWASWSDIGLIFMHIKCTQNYGTANICFYALIWFYLAVCSQLAAVCKAVDLVLRHVFMTHDSTRGLMHWRAQGTVEMPDVHFMVSFYFQLVVHWSKSIVCDFQQIAFQFLSVNGSK
jgi:hypothetical protein